MLNIMQVDFADGKSLMCKILGLFETGDQKYIALQSQSMTDVFIYRYKEIEDVYKLEEITDQAEFQRVISKFEEIVHRRDVI